MRSEKKGDVVAEDVVEVWNPDAEPWEALQEAHHRKVNDGEYLLRQPERQVAQDLAKTVSEMGWRLAPETHIKEALDEIKRRREGRDYHYLHHQEQCEHGSTLMRLDRAEERVRELEAEVERLRECLSADRARVREQRIEIERLRERVSEGDGREGWRECVKSELMAIRAQVRMADSEDAANAYRHDAKRLERILEYQGSPVPEGDGSDPYKCPGCGWKFDAPLPGLDEVCLAEMREVAAAINRALAHLAPAPVPVEEPEREPAKAESPSPAPEIKVGQVWRSRDSGAVAEVTDVQPGQVEFGFPDDPEHSWRVSSEARFRSDFDPVLPPPAPSLNPEGLAKLDAEIERLQREARDGQLGLLRDLAQKKADAYRQAREWLVSEEAENGE